MAVELTYCVMNSEQRQLLRYCLDAIARERATVDFATETIVLDNGSQDGSAEAAHDHAVTDEVIALAAPRQRAQNASELLRRASGRFCLLLDEDSELEPGATAALHSALAGTDDAGAAGATLVDPGGVQQPSAWRFPTLATEPLRKLAAGRRLLVQSRGDAVRSVDWAPLAALLVRRDAAAAVDWLEGGEVAFCRRLRAGGWRVLYVPEARAVHHGTAE
jgi:N-acetylglucosaminyl-diphospho-decaprenol L-rhamnosyltransferase